MPPCAFRAYFEDVRVTGDRVWGVTPWNGRVRWWLMAKRLEAVELLGSAAVQARFLPDCVEWRLLGVPPEDHGAEAEE